MIETASLFVDELQKARDRFSQAARQAETYWKARAELEAAWDEMFAEPQWQFGLPVELQEEMLAGCAIARFSVIDGELVVERISPADFYEP